MICEPENELKERMRKSGVTYRDIANCLGRRYSVVSSWLNGFSPLPYECRKAILQLIDERTNAKQ